MWYEKVNSFEKDVEELKEWGDYQDSNCGSEFIATSFLPVPEFSSLPNEAEGGANFLSLASSKKYATLTLHSKNSQSERSFNMPLNGIGKVCGLA